MDQWQSKSVLNQLLYRYEREVNLGQRPVLRKILEQDDNSVKHMVLFVANIIKTQSSSFYNTSTKYRLVLSDGWYKVRSCIDLRMEHAITRNRLKIGHKLSICGAQIIGDKTAQSPLSIKENDTLLSITSNGCLPARWDEKLGYHRRKLMIRPLPTIFDDGGTVTAIDIIVCRKLPILYSESLPSGATITRTAKEEEDALRRIQSCDGFNGVQRQQSYAIPNFRANHKSSNAPHLDRTVSEPKSLEDRRVSGFFKVRICDATARGCDQPWATLLLSNANELNHMDIVEGNRFRVFFVQPYHPKNKKYAGLDLKTTRMTRWEPASSTSAVKKTAYVPRFITLCADIRHQDRLSDFDLVVYVLRKSAASLAGCVSS
ncbi:BRCA2, oligonucleotide/oligosaccharide-binding, domain 1-domain-containing protein [Mucor lusitanicus]|uniref:BRCA2, oligonucleotide/oligosaccharide-binding, domain 1-domain-containing protein n=1 Tax=Mucor circinelloides f. lusitanicus TaxID=29924 RepID=A0A8H4F421_MUCCL|nr:BRCA2, oligonucleotide/oligosaccharide-binding, domain 1-domain-containing protein [Mucor lusitanicus]